MQNCDIHAIVQFYKKYIWNDKIMQFQQINIPSIVFPGSLWMALNRTGLLLMRWWYRPRDGLSYCRFSKWPLLAVMRAVKRLVRHRLLNVFLWQLCDFQLINRLRLWLMFVVLFQHGTL